MAPMFHVSSCPTVRRNFWAQQNLLECSALGRFSSLGRRSETAASAHEGLFKCLAEGSHEDSVNLSKDARMLTDDACFGSVEA